MSAPGPAPAVPPRPPAPPAPPVVETPSSDVAMASATSLPGEHRGGFGRLPTEPVGVTVESAPTEPGVTVEWIEPAPRAARGFAEWALGFAIVGLLASIVVGWGFPIGLVSIVLAIIALRRPIENRAVAIWSLVLAVVSILYSAGWLLWASSQGPLFG